ncbi:MAG: hypothetical protein U1E35_05980 [Rhodospirillales bacterium]
MLPIQQRQHHVDHGQTGADQQHRSILGDTGYRFRIPGVAEVGALAAIRREIAGGEHHCVKAIAATPGNHQRDAVGSLVQRDCLIGNEIKVCPLSAGPQLIAQQAADVGAVEAARNERILIRIASCSALGLVTAQPFDEMVRLILERAHIAGSDVQQMVLVDRRVGEASTETRPFLNEIDAVSGPAAVQQVNGKQGPTEAGADDSDAERVVVHHQCTEQNDGGLPTTALITQKNKGERARKPSARVVERVIIENSRSSARFLPTRKKIRCEREPTAKCRTAVGVAILTELRATAQRLSRSQ